MASAGWTAILESSRNSEEWQCWESVPIKGACGKRTGWYLAHVGKDTFYGVLASLRGRLFRDADFAGFYCADNGRDSVPPSLLATALLLQSHDKVSDAEAKARADFDIRWKVALGIEVEDRPLNGYGARHPAAPRYLSRQVPGVAAGILSLPSRQVNGDSLTSPSDISCPSDA